MGGWHSAGRAAPSPATPGVPETTRPCSACMCHLPSVQEEGQPEAVELVRHLGVEEGQEPAHVIHTVHLRRVACQRLPRKWGTGGRAPGHLPESRVWPPRGSSPS